MKIAVWKTGHIIADTVAEVVVQCFRTEKRGSNLVHSFGSSIADCTELHHTSEIVNGLPDADIHIGYGILRNMDKVFRECDLLGKPWFNIDKGFWKPGHYDGYYRISLNGTQQTTGLDKIKPDYERWDKLGLEVLPAKEPRPDFCLICPPTEYVQDFFGKWKVEIPVERTWKYRRKDDATQLQDDLNKASEIVTFNSSVGWEALRQGIPVVSDPNHSIIGAYRKMVDKDISKDLDERRKLFALMSSLQLTLEEMRSGKLWPLLQKLLQFT